MSKAVVLFSGGQDSTTCIFWARTLFDEVVAASVFYGQRHRAELRAAQEIAARAGVKQVVLEAPALGALGGSALVDSTSRIEAGGGHADAAMPSGLPTSFVPGRNALFLALAAAVAVREGCRDVVTGTCQTDYSGYPDCRREFIDAQERALTLAMPSSCGPIRILTPLMHLTKAETVRLARRLPGCWEALALTVTCYEGRRPGCGFCPACALRSRGFAEAGEVDPHGST
jgi:7-cyano-7-deazaguanine synthase